MAIVFRSPCEVSTDFDGVVDDTASSVTFGNSGSGYSGGSLRITYSGNFIAQYVKKTPITPSDTFQYRFRISNSATMNGVDDAVILSLFDSTAYGTAVAQIRVLGSGAGFSLRIVDPSNSFAGDYSNTTSFSKSRYHTLIVKRSSTGIIVYLDVDTVPILTYTATQTGTKFSAVAMGNFFSAAGGLVGNVDFDDVFIKNANTVTTESERIADSIESFAQRYHSNGAIIRPIDPTGGQASPDVVSEGIAYGLKLYAQGNLQTFFNETFLWAYANLRRGSAPGMSPISNTPADAFFLYGFRYNALTQVVADANWAGDADPEIAQALLWAHARWGSGGTVNYLARALEIIGDLRTYAFRLSPATGYYYLMNDSFQTGTTVQLGGDYDCPPAYRLFAQYDTSNAAFWGLAVLGAYDFQTKQANYIFPTQTVTSKLTSNWSAMTLSTAAISGTSTYGDSDWGYNSFRMMPRAYDDFRWYSATAAASYLQLPKAFLIAQWAVTRVGSPNIYAEYLHDGTVKGAYESSLFYYPYYFSLYVADNANTVASAIATTKFPAYTAHPAGGYFGAPGYFGDSWLPIYRMQIAGTYNNYGQSIVTALKSYTGMLMGI